MPLSFFSNKRTWKWSRGQEALTFHVSPQIIYEGEKFGGPCTIQTEWSSEVECACKLDRNPFHVVYANVPTGVRGEFKYWKSNVRLKLLKGITPNYTGYFYEHQGGLYRLAPPPAKGGWKNDGIDDGIMGLYTDVPPNSVTGVTVNDVTIETIPRKPCQL